MLKTASLSLRDGEKLTVRGARLHVAGVGVECPKIRTDEGDVVPVSYLAPTVAVGTRVEVTGTVGYLTTCLGPVLVVETVQVLD